MVMSSKGWLIICAAGVALSGCNTAFKQIGQEDPFLGESVRYNAAVHTINPDPIYPEGSAEPGESGVKGAAAVRRYRSDQVNARHRADSRVSSGERTTSGPN
jgi:hypothetical protein